jgi:hypothetical protein
MAFGNKLLWPEFGFTDLKISVQRKLTFGAASVYSSAFSHAEDRSKMFGYPSDCGFSGLLSL